MLCSELMCSSNDTTLLSKADRSRPNSKNVGKNQCQSEVREFQLSITTAEKKKYHREPMGTQTASKQTAQRAT